MSLPAGYEWVDAPGARVFSWAGARRSVERAVRGGRTLHDWARDERDVERLSGRGVVLSVRAPEPGPDGRERWAVRHYLRGGAVASWLGDRYLAFGPPRPLAELDATVATRARGVPAPAIVAGALYPAGPFYRADLVTELVPDAMDLAGVLFERGEAGPDRWIDDRQALRTTGALLARAARAGLTHPDLNAKNVVLRKSGGTLDAYLIDLDRCRVSRSGRRADTAAMLRRLERSLEKLSRRHGRALDGEAWRALREAVEAEGSDHG